VELYPAVDVRGGRVARSASAQDPVAVAQRFARDGARWVHFVDLDRALGTGENRELARRFLTGAGLSVQVGGGLDTEAGIAEVLGWGASRAVIGAAAATDAGLVARLLAHHGADQLAVGIDVRDGRVAARGGRSTAVFAISPVELAGRVLALGARTVIYADAARDGMLAGPDVDGARAIAALGMDVIVSGGVASLDDLRRARDAGLAGAIVGRALHEGRFTVAAALACVAE
jgi:phosphoribosylformimino-5-aminoimidazole carboxamide ribonucleotide (ProFAR) isomerase